MISRRMIVTFGAVHPDAVPSLDAWYRTVLRAHWRSLVDARKDMPHADLVERLTVFNIAGNKYRLIARVNYRSRIVFVRAILTHAEYDREGWKK